MLKVGEQTYGAMVVSFLIEKTRRFMAEQVPSFAILPREDQREWVAMAFDDAQQFDLDSERAPAMLLLALWSLGIETITERPELAALLVTENKSETARLDAFADEVRAAIQDAKRG